MRISEKINLDGPGLIAEGPITIVAFGDSVTHGWLRDSLDYESAYWNRLRKKILAIRDYVPVNVINAGIGGITAKGSLPRLEKQVLCHNPDLIIVCFGLNDVNGTVEDYRAALSEIFEKCKATGAEVIFLTPNMLNTHVAKDTAENLLGYAAVTAGFQNSGKMDLFMDAAREVAKEAGVPVADCYAIWKERSKTEDVTMLLANRINHPNAELHELFAEEIFKLLFQDVKANETSAADSMFRKE